MFELILMTSLINAAPAAPAPKPVEKPMATVAQFQPCVWPRTCARPPSAPVSATPIQTCVWPNLCREQPPVELAQFQPCVWPRTCSNNA